MVSECHANTQLWQVLYTSATVAYFSPVSRHLSSVLLSPSGPLNQGVSGLWAAEVEIDDIHDGSFKVNERMGISADYHFHYHFQG